MGSHCRPWDSDSTATVGQTYEEQRGRQAPILGLQQEAPGVLRAELPKAPSPGDFTQGTSHTVSVRRLWDAWHPTQMLAAVLVALTVYGTSPWQRKVPHEGAQWHTLAIPATCRAEARESQTQGQAEHKLSETPFHNTSQIQQCKLLGELPVLVCTSGNMYVPAQ